MHYLASVDLPALSRIVLSLTCFVSAAAAIALARITHPQYTPHMILVAFWSIWAGCAMGALALNTNQRLIPVVPDRILILNLNGAFIVAMGGWTLFALRIWRAAVLEQREQIERKLSHRRRATDQ